MPSPSKNKGNSFERQVADFLTNLYSEKFLRAPGSGAYIGGKNTVRKEFLHEGQIRTFKGDIIPGESFPRINIECKSYKDFPFHQLYTGSCKQLDEWIKQCLEVADNGDFTIIFMKFNRKGIYIATPTQSQLTYKNHTTYQSLNYGTWIIQEHNTFWHDNSGIVKQLSQ